MTKVVGVRFVSSGKEYFFDPGQYIYNAGDEVIVETNRGVEFGKVTMGVTEVEDKDVVRPLRKVLRAANEADKSRQRENEERKEKAMVTCQEQIGRHQLDMKLVDVEYAFDRSKIIFYFTSEGRVDFRDLVKDLAGLFKTRIELRQIGVRDEAKLLGGVGGCGRGLCCHEWMAHFQPVSIKMAKTQNLSLNPTKISGMCGRLMCCLKFENEVYAELGKGMPHVGERIMTPEGEAIVTDVNILIDKVKCRLITMEEDQDGTKREKYSSEIFVFEKEEVERKGRKGQTDKGNRKAKENRKEQETAGRDETEKGEGRQGEEKTGEGGKKRRHRNRKRNRSHVEGEERRGRNHQGKESPSEKEASLEGLEDLPKEVQDLLRD